VLFGGWGVEGMRVAVKRFNEDMIRRRGLPADGRGLIHDLCYDHEGRDRKQYQRRAQEIMKAERSPKPGRKRL
jgi:hypothetical protein